MKTPQLVVGHWRQSSSWTITIKRCLVRVENQVVLKKNKPKSAIITGLENGHNLVNKTRIVPLNEKKEIIQIYHNDTGINIRTINIRTMFEKGKMQEVGIERRGY